MMCPFCHLRPLAINGGVGRRPTCCMHQDCVKKRAAKTYSRFMVGKKAELEEHPVRRRVEFTNDPNMVDAIYAG